MYSRPSSICLLRRRAGRVGHLALARAVAAVHRAVVGRVEEHAIGIAVRDARHRHVPLLRQRILQIVRREGQLAHLGDRLQPDRAVRVVGIHQRRVVRRDAHVEHRVGFLEGAPLLVGDRDDPLELVHAGHAVALLPAAFPAPLNPTTTSPTVKHNHPPRRQPATPTTSNPAAAPLTSLHLHVVSSVAGEDDGGRVTQKAHHNRPPLPRESSSVHKSAQHHQQPLHTPPPPPRRRRRAHIMAEAKAERPSTAAAHPRRIVVNPRFRFSRSHPPGQSSRPWSSHPGLSSIARFVLTVSKDERTTTSPDGFQLLRETMVADFQIVLINRFISANITLLR